MSTERPRLPDGTTPRPWQTMNNGRSRLWHVETAAENPHGAGVPIVSLPKALEPDAELICRAVNAHEDLLTFLRWFRGADLGELSPLLREMKERAVKLLETHDPSTLLRCPECHTEWRVVVRVDSGPHLCPNVDCAKRKREAAWPWVAEALARKEPK